MLPDNDQVFVDLAFRIQGDVLPLDHGYALFSALSHRLPALHSNASWGVHPIHGIRSGSDRLRLTRLSRMKLRLPANEIAAALPLAGQSIDVNGCPLRLGTPDIRMLVPSPRLQARLVMIKGFEQDPDAFRDAAARQLAACVGAGAADIAIEVGKRRVLRVHGRTVVGFALALDGLDQAASLAVQRAGIGGKRRMGCGMFVPPAAKRRRPAADGG